MYLIRHQNLKSVTNISKLSPTYLSPTSITNIHVAVYFRSKMWFFEIIVFDSKMTNFTIEIGTCHHFSNCIQFEASFYHKINYWEYAGNPIQNQ